MLSSQNPKLLIYLSKEQVFIRKSYEKEGNMLEFINENIISVIAPVMLLGAGLWFSLRLKFFYLFHPVNIIKSMTERKKSGGISPFRAVTLALAGTLGVGNIAGVASSIAIGGYGSVLWMWISALLAMVLKYAEITLAIAHRRRDSDTGEYHGGAAYYIKDIFAVRGRKTAGRITALIFSILCIINSVTMGCVIQSNAVSTSFGGVFDISPWLVGGVIALLCALVIMGNARWISAFSEKTVPLMTVGYILLSAAVLASRSDRIGEAFALIFRDAFSFKSATGGALGFFLSRGLRAGVMRGLMSNEAGCGTAPTAHASADTDSPVKQGFWGLFEVFVDTILLCTLTALVIIVAGDGVLVYSRDPMMMAIKAYSSILGVWSEYYMCISVLLFAFATMICWAHYGKESLFYITRKREAQAVYIIVFCAFVVVGAISAPDGVWLAADLAIGAMTLINIPILLASGKEIIGKTKSFFDADKGKKGIDIDRSK